jgi:hypothetical protein
MKTRSIGTHTNATDIESVKLEEPLDNEALQVVKCPMISSFVNVAGSFYILWRVLCPPFSYPHLNFKF